MAKNDKLLQDKLNTFYRNRDAELVELFYTLIRQIQKDFKKRKRFLSYLVIDQSFHEALDRAMIGPRIFEKEFRRAKIRVSFGEHYRKKK